MYSLGPSLTALDLNSPPPKLVLHNTFMLPSSSKYNKLVPKKWDKKCKNDPQKNWLKNFQKKWRQKKQKLVAESQWKSSQELPHF